MTAQRVWLRKAAIRDFRNLERVDLDFPEAGLAIVGENGQGKTNLLEAIYYLQVLRSARGARDQEVVRFGERGFHIALTARTDDEHDLGVGFDSAGKKKKGERFRPPLLLRLKRRAYLPDESFIRVSRRSLIFLSSSGFMTLNSTRRLSAMPFAVLLVATGMDSP